jgi:predicted permease
MNFRKWLRLLLRDAVKRSRFEGHMTDEIRFHLESRVDDLIRSGLPRSAAERRARLEFGGVESYKEDCRQARGLRFLDELRADLRLAARQMRRTPAFTTVAVLILAIGIGANTAIFSLVDTVLLKMLPVQSPENLRHLEWTAQRTGFMRSYDGSNTRTPSGETVATSFSYSAFQYLRGHSSAIELFGFGGSSNQFNLNIRGRAELARGRVVSGNFFRVLGVEALLGRTITPEDDQPGGVPSVAVLSYGFWQRAFGGDPGALGQTVGLNGTPFVVIGVTPKSFQGIDPEAPTDVMVPMAMQAVAYAEPSKLEEPRSWWVRVMGRLPSGAGEEQARARIEFLLQQAIAAEPPEKEYDAPRIALLGGGQGLEFLRNRFRTPLLVLMAAAAAVLLIVCANIGGLLLTRAAARRKEIGTRLALGAGRPRLIRQLLTESLALAVIGGGAGIALAYALRDSLPGLLSSGSQPLLLDMSIDGPMLGFSIAACAVAGIAFGLAPALRATRVELAAMLKQGGGPGGGVSRVRTGRALVVVQVSLSLVLLAAAALFVRTVANLRSETLGFKPENLLVFQLNGTLNGYEDEPLLDLYEQVLRKIEVLPGVVSASLSRHGLLTGGRTGTGVFVIGDEPRDGSDNGSNVHYVAPRFFETMGIALLLGRDIEWSDRKGAPRVAAVNEAFARQFFQGENPLGRRVSMNRENPSAEAIEIVGMAGDSKYSGIRQSAPPTMYIPFRQNPQHSMTFVVRAVREPGSLLAALRETVESIDPNLPLFNVRTQTEQLSQAMQQERLFANLLVAFGALALFLACLGLYGTLAYSVTARIPEIGLRMALGAQRRDVAAMIVKGSLAPVGLGLALGVAGAVASAQLIESMLFGVAANDPLTLAGAVSVLMASAALAAWLPARRASRVDPMTALRYE